MGVVAEVLEHLRLPGGGRAVALRGLHRGIAGAAQSAPDGVLRVEVDGRPDVAPAPDRKAELEREYRAIVEEILELRGDKTEQGEVFSIGEKAPLALIDAPASGRMAIVEAITNLAAARVDGLTQVKLSANWMAPAGHPGEDAAMFDTVAAVNPLLVIPSIAKIPRHYMLSVALFGAVLAATGAGDYYLPKTIPVPIVPSVISTVVGLYLLIVLARVMGLLYLANKERLGWFGHR